MSRVHALTTLVALGLHTVLVLPGWLHRSFATQSHPAVEIATEIPIEVEKEAPQAKATRRARRTRPPPASKPATPAPAVAKPAPTPQATSPTPVNPAATPAPTAAAVPTGSAAPAAQPPAPAPAAMAKASLLDANANLVVLIHTAALRDDASGKLIGERLARANILGAFLRSAEMDPLRDLDHVLLTTSRSADTTAVLQYNVPRFRVRGAAAQQTLPAGTAFILAATQILVLAPASTKGAAESLPHAFRLPEPTGSQALEFYARTPPGSLTRLVPDLPATLRSLELEVLLPGDGAVEVSWRAVADSTAAPGGDLLSGHAPLTRGELEALLDALLKSLP